MTNSSKKFSLLILLSLCFFSKVFSTGIGINFNINQGIIYDNDNQTDPVNDNLLITIDGNYRAARVPLVYGFGFQLENNDYFFIGCHSFLDYWIIDHQIYNTLSFFSGIGTFSDFLISLEGRYKVGFGTRLFMGLNFTILDGAFEYFAQFNLQPSYYSCSTKNNYFALSLPADIGVRFHF